MPYSIGSDKLEPATEPIKRALEPQAEQQLTSSLQTLFLQLLPSDDSENRRKLLVEKIQRILTTRWPNAHINVQVFGSTGSRLSTTDSDVDICISTTMKELEQVCVLADLFDQSMLRSFTAVPAWNYTNIG
jgi:DNA polymerase sigma